jgi:mono/diheme cytochrome c family protein
MRASIVATCFLFGGCAESPLSSNGTQGAQPLDAVRSIRDGVFSSEQSRRGEMQYLEACKRCHQRDLRGDFIEDAPPLVGEEFLSEWAPWTVGDLFEFLTEDMPPKRKDRLELTPEIYVDILAYILEKNGFPAGQVELPPEFEPLSYIEMGPGE